MGSNPGAVGTGKCLGDTISAATYLADGALAISIAVKDCVKTSTGGEISECASDVFKSLQGFAQTANGLVHAADDCDTSSPFTADCGTDVAGALNALSKAGQLGANMQGR